RRRLRKIHRVRVHSRSGHRRIDRIRLAENSSRILDLIACEKNLSDAALGSDPQSPANQSAERFFRNERLNRAIFLKHNLREDERSLFLEPGHVETKILLPIDSGRLDIGARSFFIGERSYDQIVRDALHMDPDAEDE